MTKQSIAIALALIVAIMPFLGFSGDIKDVFYTAAGIIIAGLVHLSSFQYCNACREKIARGEEEAPNEEPEYVVQEASELEEEFKADETTESVEKKT